MSKEEIIEKCHGCIKADGKFCSVYNRPEIKWKLGVCPMATHIKEEPIKKKDKVNPLKQSRRERRRK
jgi:hypothetical protein